MPFERFRVCLQKEITNENKFSVQLFSNNIDRIILKIDKNDVEKFSSEFSELIKKYE